MSDLSRRFHPVAAAAAALAFLAAPAFAAPTVGEPAPEFRAVDAAGVERSLAEFRGKTVVLEWTNHECPYVRKHYESGNMQALQKEATGAGVVWLSIASSPPGAQGHVSAGEAVRLTQSRDAAPTAVLLDPQGKIGRSYDARVTPHMYVIDGQGVLRYAGAIDDKPTTSPASLQGASNYVKAALADVAAGRQVAAATTRAYGCTIKYESPGA
jgi:peroxiredoxin